MRILKIIPEAEIRGFMDMCKALALQPARYMKYWLFDEESEEFLVKISDKDQMGHMTDVFVMKYKGFLITIHAQCKIAGLCYTNDGCGVTWMATKIVAPVELADDSAMVMTMVHIMLRDYQHGDPEANVRLSEFKVACTPEFV